MARITDFKRNMIGAGARATQFEVTLTFPASGGARRSASARQASFLCKAASLPPSIVGDVVALYRGREVHFSGDRHYPPWNVTIYQDTSFDIRNTLESWQRDVQTYNTTNGSTQPFEYQTIMQVDQLDRRNDRSIKTYFLHHAYPTVISPIPLDYDLANQLEVFDVEFMYDFFTSPTGAVSSTGTTRNRRRYDGDLQDYPRPLDDTVDGVVDDLTNRARDGVRRGIDTFLDGLFGGPTV